MMGDLYADSLAGAPIEIEHVGGARRRLEAARWSEPIDGDESLLDRCAGPVLDVGSGPGRLTVALARRGVPTLGIDVTPHAVHLTRRAGGFALLRDVFDEVPGLGTWQTVLLADGNIGIGGDPCALLRRVRQLLRAGGAAIAEIAAPGVASRVDLVRLRRDDVMGDWFGWATVSACDAARIALASGFAVVDCWNEAERWFAHLR